MYIIELTYKKAMSEFETHLEAHRNFLERDPFFVHEIAQFKIIDFAVTKRASAFNY